jgi:hypothetical protein
LRRRWQPRGHHFQSGRSCCPHRRPCIPPVWCR